MVYITQVRMSNGAGHEHIAEVRWRNPADGKTGATSRADMVAWIDGGGVAKVQDSRGDVEVQTVKGTPAYLRTVADGRYTDNLLYLPRY